MKCYAQTKQKDIHQDTGRSHDSLGVPNWGWDCPCHQGYASWIASIEMIFTEPHTYNGKHTCEYIWSHSGRTNYKNFLDRIYWTLSECITYGPGQNRSAVFKVQLPKTTFLTGVRSIPPGAHLVHGGAPGGCDPGQARPAWLIHRARPKEL